MNLPYDAEPFTAVFEPGVTLDSGPGHAPEAILVLLTTRGVEAVVQSVGSSIKNWRWRFPKPRRTWLAGPLLPRLPRRVPGLRVTTRIGAHLA